MLCIAQDRVKLEDVNPFVTTLQQEAYIGQHGVEAIAKDLMLMCLKEGKGVDPGLI